jgi:hypothetical protein
MRARTFLQVSLGILALAAAYHLGTTSATAQVVSGNPVVATFAIANPDYSVITANGDVYYTAASPQGTGWMRGSNIFTNSLPTATNPTTTFGAIKARFRR